MSAEICVRWYARHRVFTGQLWQTGERRVQTVAPSSMSAWLKSPGRFWSTQRFAKSHIAFITSYILKIKGIMIKTNLNFKLILKNYKIVIYCITFLLTSPPIVHNLDNIEKPSLGVWHIKKSFRALRGLNSGSFYYLLITRITFPSTSPTGSPKAIDEIAAAV